jgi:electron transport complex protein RnfB
MIPITESRTAWDAWSELQAQTAKNQYESRKIRLEREKQDLLKRQTAKASAKLKSIQTESPSTQENIDEKARKKAIIEAAMARAKAQLLARDSK